jgi:acyl-CoA thioesterase I
MADKKKSHYLNLKKWLILIVFLILALIIYLNRAYAHIYQTIAAGGLKSPDASLIYNFKEPKTEAKNVTLVFLGDSLIAGVGVNDYQQSFPYLVAKKLSANGLPVKLVDQGIPGARTQDVSDQLMPQVVADQPDIVVVLVGINDIHGNISLAEFKKNYSIILERLTRETKARVYAVTLPLLGSDRLLFWPYRIYFDWRTKQFNAIINEVAAINKVKVVDLYGQTKSDLEGASSYYSIDNFHPSAVGYSDWADIIYASLN